MAAVPVGAGVGENEGRVGQRVMDHRCDGCGTCKHCRAGWTQMCLKGPVVYGSEPPAMMPQGSCPAITPACRAMPPDTAGPCCAGAR